MPGTIGDWTVEVVTPDRNSDVGQMLAELADDFFAAAGGDSTMGVYAMFEISQAGRLVTRVDGYRVVGAAPDAMWNGAENGLGIADTSSVELTAGGWDLRHFGDAPAAWVAVRGDRLFTLPGGDRGPALEQVRIFLDNLE